MFKWEEFLEQKGAEYAPFDPTRAPRLLKELGLSLEGKIVLQVIGTNGKGSTGRFLALMLKALGMKVGHFTSPHLLHVCERFWINGECVRDSVLEEAFLHLDVEVLKAASYFELLTFLAFRVFQTCDVVILEAGLGGEYDSTTTCSTPMMTLFTSIGIDHQDLLGVKLQDIATTKLNAMAKMAVLGIQREEVVVGIAREIARKKGVNLLEVQAIPQEIFACIKRYNYPSYQAENLALAWKGVSVLLEGNIVKSKALVNLAALLSTLCLDLQGRFQCLTPQIYLDVAHNVDGAKALLEHCKQKMVLVYNSYANKNPKAILSVLKPIIERVEIIAVENARMITKDALEKILQDLGIPYCDFTALNRDSHYLVCGSFSVVAQFLKDFKEGRIQNNP